MLSTKLIVIVYDMWIQRDDVLYQNDNIVTDKDHKRINEQIQIIYEGLPVNRRLLTHSEDKLLGLQQRTLLKKEYYYVRSSGLKKPEQYH